MEWNGMVMVWYGMVCDAMGRDWMRCGVMGRGEWDRMGWGGEAGAGRDGMGRAKTGRGGGVVRDMMGWDETG